MQDWTCRSCETLCILALVLGGYSDCYSSYLPSSGIASCVRTVHTVMCHSGLAQPCYSLKGGHCLGPKIVPLFFRDSNLGSKRRAYLARRGWVSFGRVQPAPLCCHLRFLSRQSARSHCGNRQGNQVNTRYIWRFWRLVFEWLGFQRVGLHVNVYVLVTNHSKEELLNTNSRWPPVWSGLEWSGFSDLEWHSNIEPFNIQTTFWLREWECNVPTIGRTV